MSGKSTNLAQNYSVAHLKRVGRESYRRKEYVAALELFNAALQQADDNIDILDYRAATFAQIGRFDLALKDGREMCRLDKRNVKAYIRIGKVLRLMDRKDLALQIYARGLRQVGPDEVRHALTCFAQHKHYTNHHSSFYKLNSTSCSPSCCLQRRMTPSLFFLWNSFTWLSVSSHSVTDGMHSK